MKKERKKSKKVQKTGNIRIVQKTKVRKEKQPHS